MARVLSNLVLPPVEGHQLSHFGMWFPDGPHADWRAQRERRSLAEILDCIPAAEKPDALLFSSPEYLPLPPDLAAFRGPKALLITDWNVCLRFLPDLCPLFDFCFTDWPGYRLLRKAGIANVFHQPLFGHAPENFTYHASDRNLDVSFCGNLNAGLHRERNRLLARVAKWADLRGAPVHLRQAFDRGYVDVLNRSKLVFNYSIRGEANMRLFEAMACGAVPLIEASNQETSILFQEGRHYFRYDFEGLEKKLDELLAEPARIEAVAAAAREEVKRHSKPEQIRSVLATMAREAPGRTASAPGLNAPAAPAPGPAGPTSGPTAFASASLKSLIKLRVLGAEYTLGEALSEIQAREADASGLSEETVPAMLSTLMENQSPASLPTAAAMLERMLETASMPETLRAFLRLRLELRHGRWQDALEAAERCLTLLDRAAADPAPGDWRAPYLHYHPPTDLGKGMNTDLNQAYREDAARSSAAPAEDAGQSREGGSRAGYLGVNYPDLIRAHCRDAMARACLALDKPAEALAHAEAIPLGRYASLEPHALRVECRLRLGDAARLKADLRDWFALKPLDTGVWEKVSDALRRIGDKPALLGFLEEIRMLSRYFMPPDAAERIQSMLDRESAGPR